MLMIREIVAEAQTEDKRLGVVEHPSVIQFQFSAPAVIILVFEVGNIGFRISIENFTADIHAPPAEERAVIGGIQACLAVIDAVLGDGVLTTISVEPGDVANRIVVIGDFGIVRKTRSKVGIARHVIASGCVVAEWIEVGKVRTCNTH